MAKKKSKSSPAPKPVAAAKSKASAPAPRPSAPAARTSGPAAKSSAPAARASATAARPSAPSPKASAGKGSAQARNTSANTGRAAGRSNNAGNSKAAKSMQIYQQPNGNAIATQAPARPSHVQESYVDAGSGQRYGTRFVAGAMLPGQRGYDAATGGGVWVAGPMKDEDVRAWYRSADPGNTAGDLAVAQSGKDASAFTLDALYGGASQAGGGNKSKSQKGATSLKQALRIAGSDGNITKKELNRATKQFDATSMQAVRQLDQLNSGLKQRGKNLKIGLGSNAVNSVLKNIPMGLANLNQAASSFGVENKFGFGSGKIGKSLSNYVNASFSPSGLMSRDQRNAAQSAAGLIPLQSGGAYQINSAGGYSPKVANKAFGNPVPRSEPIPNTAPTSEAVSQAMPTGTMDSGMPETYDPPVEETQADPGAGMMSGGGMGAAGANKLGRAKSRLRKLGIYGRGTSLLGRGLQYGNVLNA